MHHFKTIKTEKFDKNWNKNVSKKEVDTTILIVYRERRKMLGGVQYAKISRVYSKL